MQVIDESWNPSKKWQQSHPKCSSWCYKFWQSSTRPTRNTFWWENHVSTICCHIHQMEDCKELLCLKKQASLGDFFTDSYIFSLFFILTICCQIKTSSSEEKMSPPGGTKLIHVIANYWLSFRDVVPGLRGQVSSGDLRRQMDLHGYDTTALRLCQGLQTFPWPWHIGIES